MLETSMLWAQEKADAHTVQRNGTKLTPVLTYVLIFETTNDWSRQMSGCTKGVRIRVNRPSSGRNGGVEKSRLVLILLPHLRIHLLNPQPVRPLRRCLRRRMRIQSRSLYRCVGWQRQFSGLHHGHDEHDDWDELGLQVRLRRRSRIPMTTRKNEIVWNLGFLCITLTLAGLAFRGPNG